MPAFASVLTVDSEKYVSVAATFVVSLFGCMAGMATTRRPYRQWLLTFLLANTAPFLFAIAMY